MKRNLVIILVAAITFAGCKKDSGNKPPQTSSDSYLPLTSGSNWTYKDDIGEFNHYFVTITMTGATRVFNNKTYYAASSASTKDNNSTVYFYAGDHTYATRTFTDQANSTIEFQLGNDNEAVGYSWTTSPTDNGLVNTFPARTINTIKEKNITKTVNGKTFNNVIHTRIDLQYDLGTGSFISEAIYDVYLAKGVGMIQFDTRIGGALVETQTLSNYSIK